MGLYLGNSWGVLPVKVLAGEVDDRQIRKIKRRSLVWLVILLQCGCSGIGWSKENGQYHVMPRNGFVSKEILKIVNRLGLARGLWADGMIYFDFDLEDFNFQEKEK